MGKERNWQTVPLADFGKGTERSFIFFAKERKGKNFLKFWKEAHHYLFAFATRENMKLQMERLWRLFPSQFQLSHCGLGNSKFQA